LERAGLLCYANARTFKTLETCFAQAFSKGCLNREFQKELVLSSNKWIQDQRNILQGVNPFQIMRRWDLLYNNYKKIS